jgi:hypothetical protein
MPHGFFLHMEDLRELCKLHKYLNQEIEGVRVYFTFDKPQKPDHHNHIPDNIRGVFVPVYLGEAGEDRSGKDPLYMDLIVKVKRGSKEDDLSTGVSVFDVTQPCPPMCDPSSPLFQNTKKED